MVREAINRQEGVLHIKDIHHVAIIYSDYEKSKAFYVGSRVYKYMILEVDKRIKIVQVFIK